MTKRLVYILLIMLFTARVSSANNGKHAVVLLPAVTTTVSNTGFEPIDTLRIKTVPSQQTNRLDVLGGKKIKEVAKPKRQAKPEKVVAPTPVVDTAAINKKAKRQRRPDGLERPPEIPRRNND